VSDAPAGSRLSPGAWLYPSLYLAHATFRNQLDALSAKYVADYRRGDSIACTDAYTKDGLLLLPNVSPIRGRTEIAAALTAAMDEALEVTGHHNDGKWCRRIAGFATK
jgi:hypothetical protein